MSNLTYSDTQANAPLAREMLDALSACDGDRTVSAERNLLKHLQRTGQLRNDMCHVEHGCVEHGVIHICYFLSDDMNEKPKWVEVHPETGVLTHF